MSRCESEVFPIKQICFLSYILRKLIFLPAKLEVSPETRFHITEFKLVFFFFKANFNFQSQLRSAPKLLGMIFRESSWFGGGGPFLRRGGAREREVSWTAARAARTRVSGRKRMDVLLQFLGWHGNKWLPIYPECILPLYIYNFDCMWWDLDCLCRMQSVI